MSLRPGPRPAPPYEIRGVYPGDAGRPEAPLDAKGGDRPLPALVVATATGAARPEWCSGRETPSAW